MRKVIRRPSALPDSLLGEEVRAAKNALATHFRLPPVDRVRRRAPLNPKIWSSALVRNALLGTFQSKCAYCESPVNERQLGEVSHHRPVANAVSGRDRFTESQDSDNYSWLAYEWENLFLSCAECNRSKRNLFPLDGPPAPFRCTWGEAEASERALLINPCRIEPRKHLRFSFDGQVTGRDRVGNTTVKVLSLDRPSLIQARKDKLRRCLHALELARNNSHNLELFRRELHDDAAFSGAARIAFFDLLTAFTLISGATKPLFRSVVEDAIRIATTTDEVQWKNLVELSSSEFPLPYGEILPTDILIREIDYARKPRTSQIRRVSIRNFKGVPLLDLDIPPAQPSDIDAPCMMLLGENSTGKSTTLQAIALALMGEKMRDRMGAAAEDFLPREDSGWQLDDTVTPEVTIEFDTGEPVRLSIDPIAKRFIGEEHPATILFSFGSRRFFGKDLVRRQAASSLKSLFDPFAKLQHPGRWIQSLGNEDFNALARAMREVLVLQEEDRIERDEEGRLFVRAHGRDSPLEKLSDGYRSLMAMVLDVMRGMLEEWGDLENARGIVLVDEVETHLHPRWKLRVMSALRRAMPNVQFIATTHDPLCLRGMRGGEVQVLIRDGNHQIQVLTGLPDVRGLRAEQLLTSDYFGLSSTADPDVESALERLALPIDARSADANIDQETLRPFRLIGDTPIDQIANEALRRFVEEAASSRQIDRSRVREAAVNSVLDRLRAIREGRRS